MEAELVSAWDDNLHENQLRLACLDMARKNHNPQTFGSESVYDIAEEIYAWVTKRTPATIRIVTIGDVTTQQPQEDAPMQIHDNEQFSVTVEADDAKGYPVNDDQITVTVDDETVATVELDPASATTPGVTYVVKAGVPGSAVITFDAGQDDQGNQITVTEAVDVVPGGVATITLTEGAVTPQAPAAPAPGDQPPTA